MKKSLTQELQGHLYRVDKFVVPASARKEFLRGVMATHDLLEKQSGLVSQVLLEQVAGPGEFNFVTFVEWESQDAMQRAREVVSELHKQIDLNPQEMFNRLGIRADMANYQPIRN